MKSFEYSTPSTIKEALAMLSETGAMPLAGGTDLLVHMRAEVKAPKCLVDLGGLELNYVRQENGVVKIGAMTTFAEILESEIIQRHFACLAESAGEIGCVQTRNMATIGGNLCSAVPSADAAPPLLALDARVKITGRDGERVLALNQFFTGPKKNIMKPGELLVEIQVPVPPQRTGTRFLKAGRRKAMTLAVVSVAALISLNQNKNEIETARIALGAVAPIPLRATRAENILKGSELSESMLERVAATAAEEATPISDLRATVTYRRAVTQVLVKRALLKAWQKASEGA